MYKEGPQVQFPLRAILGNAAGIHTGGGDHSPATSTPEPLQSPRPTTSCATARSRTQRKPMPKVKPTCVLSESEGEKPRSALYTCSCGGQFNGLKAWREHMVARSLLHKCKRRRAESVPFDALKPAAASSPARTLRDAAQPTVHAVAGRPRRCTPFTLSRVLLVRSAGAHHAPWHFEEEEERPQLAQR